MYIKNEDIIVGVQELKVMQPFCIDYRARFHVRQIAGLLKMNHATASLALLRLEKKGVLKSEQEGRNKKCFLNLDNIDTKRYIENTESARTANYYEKHFIFKKMLNEFVPAVFMETPVILFGSYAKESFTGNSDIDILIIKGDSEKTIEKSLAGFGIRHGKKIQIQRMTQEKFEKGLMEKDTLVLEVVRNHIILNNTTLVTDILWRYYNAVR
jgi:predicted nucleotidyltransferase